MAPCRYVPPAEANGRQELSQPGIHGESIGARMIDFVPLTTARKVRLRCTTVLKGAPGSSARLSSFSVHRGDPPPHPDDTEVPPKSTVDSRQVRVN